MKNIDIKSLIIGILGTAFIFVLIGATNQNKNLGDIVVNSITVVDEKGERVGLLQSLRNGGVLSLNKAGKPPMVALVCEDEGGTINTFNAGGKKISFLGADAEDGGGHLATYNEYGKPTSYLGTGEGDSGQLETFNSAGVRTGYFGTNKDNDGVAVLFDRYGDGGWAAEGKQ